MTTCMLHEPLAACVFTSAFQTAEVQVVAKFSQEFPQEDPSLSVLLDQC